jgi:hypothetical protein
LCSSSLRYKTDIARFAGGLEIINRLRPITFTWKEGGLRDIGLGAEEVEKVEPLLTFRNGKGEIKGVKYSQLNVVLINAIKQQQQQIIVQRTELSEQQEQIRQQQAQIRKQQTQTESLMKLVCLDHPQAKACRASKVQ